MKMTNKLFVYVDKELKSQPESFHGSNLNTCNTESPRGYAIQNNPPRQWIFECEPGELYDDEYGPISGTLRYGLYTRVECTFNNRPEFIGFMKMINRSYIKDFIFWFCLILAIISCGLLAAHSNLFKVLIG